MALSAADAVEILDRLESMGVWYCLEGGWGVDALLEEQTREHDDLDLGVPIEDVDRVCAALPEFEASDDRWPSSLELRDPGGRRIDCHPLAFDERGDGWQANLRGEPFRWPREHIAALGRIHGRAVRCISAELSSCGTRTRATTTSTRQSQPCCRSNVPTCTSSPRDAPTR